MKFDASLVYLQICELLSARNVAYLEVEHSPTYTSEESASARGEDLRVGGKALLLKADKTFVLVVIPADNRLDSKKAHKQLSCRRLRFATKKELFEMTGLLPGSVPPFGPPLYPHPLYVDRSLLDNNRIAFNAGSLVKSLIVPMGDYLKIAKPEIGDFVI